MAANIAQFCRRLVDCQLLSETEIAERRDAEDPLAPAVDWARDLVKNGKLTPFQAKRLVATDGRLIWGNVILEEQLPSGGMGEVYKGFHRGLQRPAVVKTLLNQNSLDAEARKRFQREIQAAASLSHRNIVSVLHADQYEGDWFMVMEFIDGLDLATLVARDGPLQVPLAVNFIAQAAAGLHYAHEQGVIHRDVKPGNLLLDNAGVVKVFDLGLACYEEGYAPAGDTQLTDEHQIVGTVDYMAPEQAVGTGPIDRRCDIYSLGCSLHRLLTGSPPYHGDQPLQVLLAHRSRPIPSLVDQRPDVPAGVDRVFRRMVAKRASERYTTMAEVIDELKPFQSASAALSAGSLQGGNLADTGPIRLTAEEESSLGIVREAPKIEVQPTASNSSTLSGINMETTAFVGIDLGTTYSAISHLDEHGRPQTLNNLEGDKITPSAVFFEGDDVIIGKEALKAVATDADNVAETAKRDLGYQFYRKQLAGREFPPQALEAWVINKLRVDAEKQIGPVHRAVITVPAYFDEVRRKATQDAGYIAGLEVLDIINEPTAAALAFGFREGYLSSSKPDNGSRNILVYDLGGGTFDVTVMKIEGNRFIALATDGDWLLGGRDWDERLVDYAAEAYMREFHADPRQDSNSHGLLWRECEDAKRTLSARRKARITVAYRGQNKAIEITRKEFQAITQDLLDRTLFTTKETLREAKLEWSDIERVLLVGGSTRMPAVVESLRELSGKEPDGSISPDEAVSHGAALYADLLISQGKGETPTFVVRNVNSHSLGVVATDPKTKDRRNSIIIPRNTPLPVKATQYFKTVRDDQKSIHVQIVEGESNSPEDCYPLGACTLRNLPPNLPAQTRIAVRFQYETNGRLQVTVRVDGVDKPLNQEITRSTAMTNAQLNSWRKHISGRDADLTAEEGTEP